MFNSIKNQSGQVLILSALLFPVFAILAGFAVDIGWVTLQQSKIQDAADFSALAGAQHLPVDILTAYDTALSTFRENFPEPTTSENITFTTNSRIIKVHFEADIPSIFMKIVGIKTYSIAAKAEAMIEPISQPKGIVPIAVFHTQPLVYGQEVVLYGNTGISTVGNFGIVDPSNGGLTTTKLENWIAYDYITSPMPKANDMMLTDTGLKSGPISKGINKRISEGRLDVICPIADFSNAHSSSYVPILGFARFKIKTISDISTGLTIVGVFTEYIDSTSLGDKNLPYFGTKTIRLIE